MKTGHGKHGTEGRFLIQGSCLVVRCFHMIRVYSDQYDIKQDYNDSYSAGRDNSARFKEVHL